jgi:hypothetical protein
MGAFLIGSYFKKEKKKKKRNQNQFTKQAAQSLTLQWGSTMTRISNLQSVP